MPTWTRRRLNRQERWIMAYVRRHPGTVIDRIKASWNLSTRSIVSDYATKTDIRGWIRSAQLKGAPLATTANGVVIATGTAVHQQALRMKIHALGELKNAAILMHTRLSDRLVGQIDAMGRDRAVVR